MSNLIKRDNFVPSVNTLLDDFFSREFFDWSDKNFTLVGNTLPSVNLKETEKEYRIELAAPGLKKDDFKVELNNNVLSISSEHKEEHEEKNKRENFARKEFNYQSFLRSFNLPDSIDDDKVKAQYENGILHVNVAKKAPSALRSAKRIPIS
jgi:HSP20 family protein